LIPCPLPSRSISCCARRAKTPKLLLHARTTSFTDTASNCTLPGGAPLSVTLASLPSYSCRAPLVSLGSAASAFATAPSAALNEACAAARSEPHAATRSASTLRISACLAHSGAAARVRRGSVSAARKSLVRCATQPRSRSIRVPTNVKIFKSSQYPAQIMNPCLRVSQECACRCRIQKGRGCYPITC
jgi:hypothetical protein